MSISIGFLFYNYSFTDYGYGMMAHHYGYYDSYSGLTYYLNMSFVIISYSVIIIGTIALLSMKTKPPKNSLKILDERLSKGEISIDEYQNIQRIVNSK